MNEGGSVEEVSLSLSLSLSEEAPWRGPGGRSFTEDPGRYVKKVSKCRHLSPWGPLSSRWEPGMWEGSIPGTLIDEYGELEWWGISLRGIPLWGP
jgi:hypothetical protein